LGEELVLAPRHVHLFLKTASAKKLYAKHWCEGECDCTEQFFKLNASLALTWPLPCVKFADGKETQYMD
jgi:hypothetical protein